MEWLSFPEEVEVFGTMMMSQVDLRIEANNLETFENNFRHFPTVSFPRALKSYTSPQVLTEEFEDAVPLEAFLSQGGGPFDDRIANLGLDAFLVSPISKARQIVSTLKLTLGCIPEHAAYYELGTR